MISIDISIKHVTVARWLLATAAIACVGGVLAGQSIAQNPPNIYSVGGIVEDSVTHQPIARVLVEGRSEAVLTDSGGRFELHLPAGANQITLRRPGYPPGSANSGHSIIVGPKTPSVVFYLTPSASISGHVLASSGDEEQGFQITLYRKRSVEGHGRWEQSGHATTWSDGSFRLLGLDAPGSYVLCVAPFSWSSNANVPGAPIYGYAGACYPGGTDAATAAASALKLEPGKEAQVEISLARQQFFPVSISVTRGAQNMGVQLYQRGGIPAGIGVGRNNETGAFETSLPNGSYYFEAHIWGKEQQYGRVDFTVAGAPVSGLTLVPRRVLPIKVNLRREFTANPQQPDGTLSMRGSNISLTMFSADNSFIGSFGVNLRPIDGAPPDSGDYQLDAPPQGSYWLVASGYGSYVSSMTTGSTDLLREPLVVGESSRAEPIEITLRNDTGGLECRASAESTAGDDPTAQESLPLNVYAISQSPNQSRIYPWITQPSPRMHIARPLPPGNYLVVAFKQVQEIDLDDQDEMSRLASHGQVVTITPGATTQVIVDPFPAGDQEASQ